MTPAIQRIDHIHVHVSDREQAEAWYRRVLGFERIPELAFWDADGGPLTLANRERTVKIALFERGGAGKQPAVALEVEADAFQAWRRHLKQALGHAPELADHAVSWSIYFADPDGNGYEITCNDYAALAQRLRACP
ncbi:VOC family protein [Chromobacterium subtsugae]|uniref:VOC family protein n=1 Tax=Chromobacterium subtsugae TaxID=251747 RepID=A0ABS7FLL8_9NEIS|nr:MULTISPECIES: VOC family protein [Chromobacterium]KUM02878.1 hypothetical protein Cv017_22420 [Chromobacterium subtsugae]KZE84095.1 hypothetical protein AWB61_05185 [Chromobacterium sp. F49]MBW7568617.1 VOC family protein [Chromobacterium subtsugae]MBW8290203.1 VOC family protein [Chromobacterium subtsugae]OBU86043.1 hypothetical protein MY55_13380 [Chromobacterium subtsugae]